MAGLLVDLMQDVMGVFWRGQGGVVCHTPVYGSPADTLDPICIRSGLAGKHWPETGSDDCCRPACFRTRSLWPKPDLVSQNQIRSGGFSQYDPGHLWKNATEMESGKLVVGWLCSAYHARRFLHMGLLMDRIHLAGTWPGHPDWIQASFCTI